MNGITNIQKARVAGFVAGALAGYLVGTAVIATMRRREDPYTLEVLPQDEEDASDDEEMEEDSSMGDDDVRVFQKQMEDYIDYSKLYRVPQKQSIKQLSKKVAKNPLDEDGFDIVNWQEAEMIETREVLLYYTDDVVTDIAGNIIEDVEDLIGSQALGAFGVDSKDNDIVFIRNLATMKVYEVTRLHTEFYEGAEADWQ